MLRHAASSLDVGYHGLAGVVEAAAEVEIPTKKKRNHRWGLVSYDQVEVEEETADEAAACGGGICEVAELTPKV